MRSVTEQAALEEFLSTAELAGTDFTAEKMNSVKIIHTDQKNPYLLSTQEERAAVRKHNANKGRLTVPRRPPWDETTTPQELDARERESQLEWRRGLANLQENQDLLMTPFERNLEVWRQLWRVIERSDLVVQIVDARNPLLFRSEDLEHYVKEVDERKNNLLLVNKADMMTLEQRLAWAEYFEHAGINYRFFSAALAREANEARGDNSSEGEEEMEKEKQRSVEEKLAHETKRINLDDEQDAASDDSSGEDLEDEDDERTRILTVDELEALFLENAPEQAPQADPDAPTRKTTVGLVGYPNVGKSSTINALIGAKKVSVSATPGKTKHFQTIHLSPSVLLCDCPGLVFPNFATTKAELVCSGILPIDQLREFTGPAGLVARRIPLPFFEAVYGVHVPIRPLEEGGTGIPTAEEILSAYAAARGFSTQGQGQPDSARAARYVLKDYVSGKLLFCHPPPSDPPIDPADFNRGLYDAAHLPNKRRAGAAILEAAQTEDVELDEASLADAEVSHPPPGASGAKSKRVDKAFFGTSGESIGHISRPFNHVYSQQGRAAAARIVADAQDAGGKVPSGRKLRALVAMERGVAPEELSADKKHFKGQKRAKRKEAQKAVAEY